jgi:hypothetical protein
MQVPELCKQALDNMRNTANSLSSRVPPPQLIRVHGHLETRYVEKTIHQALILKLVRVISNLSAAQLLLDSGYVTEQAALQRMLDEGHDDISFLALALIDGTTSELHKIYLEAFWQEEFDTADPLKSTQKRPSVQRKKINAWLARHPSFGSDPSSGVAATTTVYKAYSGYIHGASQHILEMYGGEPARFHMTGLLGTPRHQDHAGDLLNYYYRSIAAIGIVSLAFGDGKLFANIRDYSKEFLHYAGMD